MISLLDRVENTVGKGENASYLVSLFFRVVKSQNGAVRVTCTALFAVPFTCFILMFVNYGNFGN